MKITCLEVGPFASNCYLVSSDGPRALVIDPGGDAAQIRNALTAGGWIPEAILLTHGHVDHVSGLAELLKTHPVPVFIHPLDRTWAFGPANRLPPYYAAPVLPPDVGFRELADGETIEAAGLGIRVIATPGHTPGGVCFLFEKEGELFTGDTLFQGTVGRTDLPGGDARTLSASLKKLARLPGPTRVHPGHGVSTGIAEELRSNYFLANAAG